MNAVGASCERCTAVLGLPGWVWENPHTPEQVEAVRGLVVAQHLVAAHGQAAPALVVPALFDLQLRVTPGAEATAVMQVLDADPQVRIPALELDRSDAVALAAACWQAAEQVLTARPGAGPVAVDGACVAVSVAGLARVVVVEFAGIPAVRVTPAMAGVLADALQLVTGGPAGGCERCGCAVGVPASAVALTLLEAGAVADLAFARHVIAVHPDSEAVPPVLVPGVDGTSVLVGVDDAGDRLSVEVLGRVADELAPQLLLSVEAGAAVAAAVGRVAEMAGAGHTHTVPVLIDAAVSVAVVDALVVIEPVPGCAVPLTAAMAGILADALCLLARAVTR